MLSCRAESEPGHTAERLWRKFLNRIILGIVGAALAASGITVALVALPAMQSAPIISIGVAASIAIYLHYR